MKTTEINKVYLGDCLELMPKHLEDKSIDMVLADIPYNAVNRKSNGLRNLNKGIADIMTFNIENYLNETLRVCNGVIIIFCGKEQFSSIFNFFANKKGTTRPIIWQKSNPSPMNGQHIYLSGVEMGVWFKPRGFKTFNAHCKNTVFKYANGRSKIHPTEKNHELLKELILDNTNEGDLILDNTCGSGTTGLVAKNLKRNYIMMEQDPEYYRIACKRVQG